MVLGMAWLANLGDIRANFHELTLKWNKVRVEYLTGSYPVPCSILMEGCHEGLEE